MKQAKTTPDSKEGLHTQGEDFWLRLNEGTEDENTMTFGEYVRSCEELDKEFIDEILTIGHFAIDEAKWIEHDFVRRISPPVNERKALPELLKTIYHSIDIRCFTETENVSMTAIREELVKLGANEKDLW